MNTRKIKLAGALLLGIIVSTSLNAQSTRQGGRGTGPQGPGDGNAYGMRFNRDYSGAINRMDRLAWLDLSEEQQEAITNLRTAHFKEITPMKNKMAELKARERTLLSEENVDITAVNKTIDEQTDLTNFIRKLQVEQQLKIKELLTDEQLMKMQQGRQYARGDGSHGRDGQRNKGRSGTGRGYRGI